VSWNKNTSIDETIDVMIYFIENQGGVKIHPSWSQTTIDYFEHPYKVNVIGEVIGRGLNDIGNHRLRRLEYKGSVWLERMERHPDCDCDDWIKAYVYKKEEEPENWEIEIYTNDE
jgi:hypothetical protein